MLVSCPIHARTVLEAEHKSGDPAPPSCLPLGKEEARGLLLCGHCRGAPAQGLAVHIKGSLLSTRVNRPNLHRMCYEKVLTHQSVRLPQASYL